jgi:hypothetical protein
MRMRGVVAGGGRSVAFGIGGADFNDMLVDMTAVWPQQKVVRYRFFADTVCF